MLLIMKKRCRVFSRMREIGQVLDVDETMRDHLLRHGKAADYDICETTAPKKRGRPRKQVEPDIKTPESRRFHEATIDVKTSEYDAQPPEDS